MISPTAEYALRALVYLAANEKTMTGKSIAEGTKVPTDYLSKIMQSLTKAKLVKSQRGLHGGFTLTRDPREITLLDVVTTFDTIERIHSCPLGLEDHCEQLCPLHQNLDAVNARVESQLSSLTIAKLLKDRKNTSVPLCLFPHHSLSGEA